MNGSTPHGAIHPYDRGPLKIWQTLFRMIPGAVYTTIILITVAQACANTVSESVPLGSAEISDSCGVRPQDEIWFISTRHLGCPSWYDDAQPSLEVLYFDHDGRWVESSIAAFLDQKDEVEQPITAIYTHGNRVDRSDSFSSGWTMYHALTERSCRWRPLRFVIWSWPSDQILGPLRDIREKATRSDADGYYLGWLLSKMDANRPVSLIGYSYGARIVLGGLHVSAGGWLCGKALSLKQQEPMGDFRVVLLAAAVHNYWLMPTQQHDHAYRRLSRMLMLYNSCDGSLQRYHWVDRCARPEAMGYTGVAGTWQLDDHGKRIDQIDVCCDIGRTHNITAYLSSPSIMQQIRRNVFGSPAP